MLKFSQFTTISEAKIDDYKASESSISTEHDPTALHKSSSDIIDHFHSHNPTGDINHTKWVVNQYKKGFIKQEDAPAMGDLLKKFNQYKDQLPKKKIEQYKTHGDLNTALEKVKPSKKDIKSEREQNIIENGSTVVHDSPNVTMYHVHNTEASRVLGKGLPWCTSRMDHQNMFNHYNAMSSGRFYIGHLHKESFPYRRLGIGVGAGEFQDENNDKITGDRLKELIERNPELRDIHHLQGANFHITKNPKDHLIDLLENDTYELEKHMREHPEQYSPEHHELAQLHGFQHSAIEDGDVFGYDAFDTDEEKKYKKNIIEGLKNSPFLSVRKKLASYTHFPSILADLSNDEHPSVRSEVAKNSMTNDEDKIKLLKDKVPFVRGSVRIHYIQDHDNEINEILRTEENPDVLHVHARNLDNKPEYAEHIFSNPNATDKTLGYIGHNISPEKLLTHKNVGKYTISKAWNNFGNVSTDDKAKDKMAERLLNHSETGDETLVGILHHVKSKYMLASPKEYANHVNKILSHKNIGRNTFYGLLKLHDSNNPDLKHVPETIFNHKNVDDRTLNQLYEEKHITKDQLKSKGNKLGTDSLEHFISDDPHFVLNHPNVSEHHINNIVDKHHENPDILEKSSKVLNNISNKYNDNDFISDILTVSLRNIFKSTHSNKNIPTEQKNRIIDNLLTNKHIDNYDLEHMFNNTEDLSTKLKILHHPKTEGIKTKMRHIWNEHGKKDNPELHKILINHINAHYGLDSSYSDIKKERLSPLEQLANKYNVKTPIDDNGYLNRDEFNKQIDKHIARKQAAEQRQQNIPEPEPRIPPLSSRQRKQGMFEQVYNQLKNEIFS